MLFRFEYCRGLPDDDQSDFEQSLPRGWTLRETECGVQETDEGFFKAQLALYGPKGAFVVARSGLCPTEEDACRGAIAAVPAAIDLEPRLAQLRAAVALEKQRSVVAAQAVMLEMGVLRVPKELAPTIVNLCTSADGDHVILTKGAMSAAQASEAWRRVEALVESRQQPHRRRIGQLATEINRLAAGEKDALVESLRRTL